MEPHWWCGICRRWSQWLYERSPQLRSIKNRAASIHTPLIFVTARRLAEMATYAVRLRGYIISHSHYSGLPELPEQVEQSHRWTVSQGKSAPIPHHQA